MTTAVAGHPGDGCQAERPGAQGANTGPEACPLRERGASLDPKIPVLLGWDQLPKVIGLEFSMSPPAGSETAGS